MNGIGRPVEWMLNVFERLIVLVTGVTLVVSMLYVAGNYQEFSDSTQQVLLVTARFLGAVTVVSLVPAIVAEFLFITLGRRWSRLRRLAALVVAGLVVGSILLGSAAVLVLQQPL